MALRELLGEGAPLSASSLQRLKEKWQGEYEQWKSTGIEEKDWVYLWADGIYVKARIGKEKAALLVVIGVQEDGTKRFLALEPGYRESKESWAAVLRQLKARAVKNARLFVGDGNLGLWAAVGEVYPQSQQQLCWNHKMINVIDAVSKKEQVEVKKHLTAMMYAESRQEALKKRKKFEQVFRHNPKMSLPPSSRILPAPANGCQPIRFSMGRLWPSIKAGGSRSISFSITVQKHRHCSFTPSTFSFAAARA